MRRSRIRKALQDAQATGDADPQADVELVVNMAIGYYHSTRVGGAEITQDWPRRCVAMLRKGIGQVSR